MTWYSVRRPKDTPVSHCPIEVGAMFRFKRLVRCVGCVRHGVVDDASPRRSGVEKFGQTQYISDPPNYPPGPSPITLITRKFLNPIFNILPILSTVSYHPALILFSTRIRRRGKHRSSSKRKHRDDMSGKNFTHPSGT